MRGEGVEASLEGLVGVGCGVTRGCRSAKGRLELDFSGRGATMTKGVDSESSPEGCWVVRKTPRSSGKLMYVPTQD